VKSLQYGYHLNVMILLLDNNQITHIISCQQSLELGLAGAGPLMSASVAHQAAGLTNTCDEQHSLHSQVCTCHARVHRQFNTVSAHALAAGVTHASLYCLAMRAC